MTHVIDEFTKSILDSSRKAIEMNYREEGITQNEKSLDPNVLIKDTNLSTRFKNILISNKIDTIGKFENLKGSDVLYFKGMGEKLHREHSRFLFVNRIGIHRN
jgi:DNA-directed RNA polymerase alpha subunit